MSMCSFPVVRVGDNNSKVAQHANQFVHSIDFDHAKIVGKARNFHERPFLEAWYSQRDNNAGNAGCFQIPRIITRSGR